MTTQQTETTPSREAFASQLQVFASAWAIVGGQFDAGDGMQTADAERAIVLDMWRRLHAENEQLRAGDDAARQEIASLRAQPYDQQAMGLCHVCGWKGVIDYPDGPVCVACEHDKTLPPQPAAQTQEDVGGWRRAGALLYRLSDKCRPRNFDEIRVTMANGSRDIDQTSSRAARLLVMLSAPQPALGVEAVSEREFKQFLSDVITAAGLVTHGNKCKDLGHRLGEMSMRLLTAPKTAAAPTQAQDALKEIGAIAVSALKTNSRDIADWREDIDQIAARAAQKGSHD